MLSSRRPGCGSPRQPARSSPTPWRCSASARRRKCSAMPHTLKDVLPVTAVVHDGGHLEIGGCDTVGLAAEFGTPLYVFDEATFRARARELRGAFPEASLYFAAKACPA